MSMLLQATVLLQNVRPEVPPQARNAVCCADLGDGEGVSGCLLATGDNPAQPAGQLSIQKDSSPPYFTLDTNS